MKKFLLVLSLLALAACSSSKYKAGDCLTEAGEGELMAALAHIKIVSVEKEAYQTQLVFMGTVVAVGPLDRKALDADEEIVKVECPQ